MQQKPLRRKWSLGVREYDKITLKERENNKRTKPSITIALLFNF